FNLHSFLVAVVGAIVVLVIFRLLRRGYRCKRVSVDPVSAGSTYYNTRYCVAADGRFCGVALTMPDDRRYAIAT
ncbi:hypothetical protein SEET0012_07573, partial [Salmonella enterica subsp. enterica serovar Tallahassee str. 0012]